MSIDVVDLRDFYAESLGHMTGRLLGARVRALWPDTRGLRVAGLGYAGPLLAPFAAEAERVLALMPAAQGVLRWPREGANLSALVDETDLPLPDRSIDRLLVVHAIEASEQVRPMLREIWRVMADGGRLLIVAPNRSGLWSQREMSPFSHGQPYSVRQLGTLLRAAPAVERLGERWLGRLGGVVVVEAAKQLYAGTAARDPVAPAVVARPRLRVAWSREGTAARDSLDPPAPTAV